MVETILVTGATGTVGSEVINQLSKNTSGINIRAAVHSAESAKKITDGKVKPVQIDYNKPETLRSAFNNTNKLFLLTHDSPDSAVHASNLVSGAKKAGVNHIVKQSIMGADLYNEIGTMRLHRQAEKMIEDSGIPYTFLRPNEFMQGFVNYQSPTIKSSNAFYIPAGDGKVSFVDARDIAAVAVKALTDSSGTYDDKAYLITGPEAMTYHKAAEILSDATGKKIDYVNISDEESISALKQYGLNDWLVDTISKLNVYFRNGRASQVSSAIEEVTGNKPITFAQFAKDYAEAFK